MRALDTVVSSESGNLGAKRYGTRIMRLDNLGINQDTINEAINKLSVLKDNSFVDKGFVSTCRDEFEDDGFGDIRLDIKTNKNTKGLALESISDFPEEQEILLQRNTKFKITDIKTSNKKNAKIIIECEVINE